MLRAFLDSPALAEFVRQFQGNGLAAFDFGYMLAVSTEMTTARDQSTTLSALGAFVERRALVMLALGFSAGLPAVLIFTTLSLWLRDSGVALETIAFFSLVTVVYSIKFLWAPLVDRVSVPVLAKRIGHWRSWMLVCQGVIMLGFALVSLTDPASRLGFVTVLALVIGFWSATQDIAIDAWRIEVAAEWNQGVMAAAYQWGYRIAILVAGTVPLLLAAPYGWNVSYGMMAVFMTVGLIAVMAAPSEARAGKRAGDIRNALGDSVRDFLSRYGSSAALILTVICVYRMSELVRSVMNPFYLDLGFTLTEIAEVRGVFGTVMTMAGVLAGGVAVARLGVARALFVGALAGPVGALASAWLATRGSDVVALLVVTAVESVGSGFAGTCLIAYMSGLTAAGFTATQYALLSSLWALPGRLLASQSGRIVEGAASAAEPGGMFSFLNRLFSGMPADSYASAANPAALGSGYVVFFLYSALIGVSGAVLALTLRRRDGPER